MKPVDDSGFTLVELVVALALVAMMSVMLLGAMRTATRVWERSGREAERTDEVVAARRALSSLLAQAYPAQLGLGARPPGVFVGDGERVSFYAPGLPQMPSQSLYRFALEVRRNGAAGDLVLSWSPKNAGAVGSGGGDWVVVVSGVKRIRFRYFESGDASSRPHWRDSWRSSKLPVLIGLAMDLASDRDYWPELVVKPEIDRDARCVYDPVSRDCRGRA